MQPYMHCNSGTVNALNIFLYIKRNLLLRITKIVIQTRSRQRTHVV